MKRALLVLFLAFQAVLCFAQAREDDRVIPYTLSDRDRSVRIEARLDAFMTESSRRSEQMDAALASQQVSMQTGFDRTLNGIYWGTSLIVAILLFLVGFIFYDRKIAATASNRPLKDEIDLMKALLQKHEAEFEKLKAKLNHD